MVCSGMEGDRFMYFIRLRKKMVESTIIERNTPRIIMMNFV